MPFFVGVGAVVGVLDYDVEQNIYGVPDYLGGMHALLLNESATLFRRRYYTNDPNLSEADEERMQPRSGLAKGWGISGRCL